MPQELKRIPLYEQHVALGAKIVPFAGWEMPVQYSGIIGEHNAVRNSAGLFDVSHMGELLISGPDAEEFLQYISCNNLKSLYDGKAQYSAFTNERGGVVDDIIVYRFSSENFLICVNASNTQKDYNWVLQHKARFKVEVEDASAEFGQLALQGPLAAEILAVLLSKFAQNSQACLALKPFHFADCQYQGARLLIARTGYTGEDGFEFFVPTSKTAELWSALLEIGKSKGLLPIGLGARDSLRLEACYPLHGHELAEDISAIESGLGWIVKFDKGNFIGREVLEQEKRTGSARSLIAFLVEDAGIVRHGDKLYSESGEEIGYVTSGTKTPTLNRALGMALVKSAYREPGLKIVAAVRDKRLVCKIASKPLYKRK